MVKANTLIRLNGEKAQVRCQAMMLWMLPTNLRLSILVQIILHTNVFTKKHEKKKHLVWINKAGDLHFIYNVYFEKLNYFTYSSQFLF